MLHPRFTWLYPFCTHTPLFQPDTNPLRLIAPLLHPITNPLHTFTPPLHTVTPRYTLLHPSYTPVNICVLVLLSSSSPPQNYGLRGPQIVLTCQLSSALGYCFQIQSRGPSLAKASHYSITYQAV